MREKVRLRRRDFYNSDIGRWGFVAQSTVPEGQAHHMVDDRKRGEWIRPFYFSPDELQSLAIERARSYQGARPFPHGVFDGLIPEDVIDGLLAEFPALDDGAWTRY